MSGLPAYNPMVEDPLVATLALHQPITADVLRKAIAYQEAHIEIRTQNVQVLKAALKRYMGVPPAEPALQERARRVRAPAE